MIPCTIQEICAAVGGTLLQDSPAAITGVTTDSRARLGGPAVYPLTGERSTATPILTPPSPAAQRAA